MRPCPDCTATDLAYRREGTWLAIVCAWCGLELHGIDIASMADVEGVADEAA